MDPGEYQRQVDDSYRAIGRYTVRFSHLIHYMRFLMARRLTKGEPSPVVAELALGEAMHSQIAAAFFAICRHEVDLDHDEKKVESALRNQVTKVIETRTNYAHGDWSVGQMWTDADHILPPSVVRVRPRASEPVPEKVEDVPVKKLDEQSDAILALLEQVSVFGRVCLQQRILLAKPPPGMSPISEGDLRVRDVLVVEKGKVVPGPKWDWLTRPD